MDAVEREADILEAKGVEPIQPMPIQPTAEEIAEGKIRSEQQRQENEERLKKIIERNEKIRREQKWSEVMANIFMGEIINPQNALSATGCC